MPNDTLINVVATAVVKSKEQAIINSQNEAEIILSAIENAGYRIFMRGDNIEKQLENVYGVSFKEIAVKTRDRSCVEPRQVGMFFNYIHKEQTRLTLNNIGKMYGKDHATVISAKNHIINLLPQPSEGGLRQKVEEMSALTGIEYKHLVEWDKYKRKPG